MTQPIARVSPKNQATSASAEVSRLPERRQREHDGEPRAGPRRRLVRVPSRSDRLARRAGADHQSERHRAHHRARLDRAVAMSELQVLSEREDAAEQGEERDADRRRADAEAARCGRSRGRASARQSRRSHQRNAPSSPTPAASDPSTGPDRPAALGGLDDRVHEGAEAGRGERRSEQVERARPRIAALRDVAEAEEQCERPRPGR